MSEVDCEHFFPQAWNTGRKMKKKPRPEENYTKIDCPSLRHCWLGSTTNSRQHRARHNATVIPIEWALPTQPVAASVARKLMEEMHSKRDNSHGHMDIQRQARTRFLEAFYQERKRAQKSVSPTNLQAKMQFEQFKTKSQPPSYHRKLQPPTQVPRVGSFHGAGLLLE